MAKFSHSLDNFNTIVRQPPKSDLTRLREVVTPLLIHILYNETGAVHNLISLIRTEAAYVAHYGEAFPKPTRVGAFDKTIDNNAMAVLCVRTGAAHKAKRTDCATYKTARQETTQFFIAVVTETWFREL